MSQHHEPFPTDRPAVVTCGLPYANGPLHIGHLRGNLAADVYARALDALGQPVTYVCGSDMHGTPIAVNADEEGVTPEELALSYHEQFEETFERFNVDFGYYGHTHQPSNVALTQSIVSKLDDGGYVTEREIDVAWDPQEDQPLPDRYVEGICPYCGETARGDECDEGCGRHLEPGEIESPRSTITGNPAEYRTREHKFFTLSAFQEYLQSFIDRLDGTDNARNQPREWIEGELQDWCITRDLDWGIDYPDESGDTDLVLYVWVDAPIEYIAATKEYSDQVGADEYDWETVWKEDGEIVHVIGPDIIQHHTVFWPAMLDGAGYNEPRAVMACGFVTLAGAGFSTSRNRAVWANEYLEEGFDPDLLRYYLATQSSFQQDLDFSWEQFQERINSELIGTLGNFVYRSLLFAQRNYGGTPDIACPDGVTERIDESIDAFADGVNAYSVRDVSQVPVELARFGNEYIQSNEPWNLVDEDPEEAKRVIRGCVQLAKAIAVFSHPTTPGIATRLFEQLGESASVTESKLEDAHSPPPASFDEPNELFEPIEDDHVETLTDRLEATTDDESMETETTTDEINDDRISFDEFQALDLRVGEILDAEPIDGADKLLRLTVDIGTEERQIVAGLAQLHDVSQLPGTRVVIVANLEKAELFGVESNGMVLAAGEDADLLTTHEDSDPGTKVQ
ncbi:methionine--tRNA ligase [Halocatena halophila]|uniref:methionine--tRNA ligase n=1 Tax=Halocatena halophila TaxID=2814576 RepID=UPI002ED05620